MFEAGNIDSLRVWVYHPKTSYTPATGVFFVVYLMCTVRNVDIRTHVVSPVKEVDDSDEQNATPLISVLSSSCAENKLFQTVNDLLTSGTSVNRRNTAEWSPLHIAAGHCSLEVCRVLISHGADVNACDIYKHTPLSVAVEAERPDNVVALLDAGANIEISDKFGDSPFQVAARSGNLSMMKLLYSRGADPNYQGHNGSTALHLAALGQYDIAKYLVIETMARLDIQNELGETAFIVAVGQGNMDIANLFVRSGYNPSEEELTFDQDDLMMKMIGMADLIEDWKRVISVPRRLQELCVFKIRRILQGNFSSVVATLPLPNHFKEEILMTQI